MKRALPIMLLAVCMASVCRAQGIATAAREANVDFAAGFVVIHSNAGPTDCGCFYQLGGNIQASAARPSGIGLVFDVGETSTSNINGGNHDLKLYTFLAGARYMRDLSYGFRGYAQALVGAGHSSTDFIYDNGQTALAYAGGGGLNYRISSRFSARILEVDYLLTEIPNAANNKQNQLRLTAGVVFHLRR